MSRILAPTSFVTIYDSFLARVTSDMYKYFIPLYVQGTVGQQPLKYRVDCEIKIGGMVRTLSANLVLVKDFIVAPEGSALWGIINNSYVQQNGVNYSRGSFYRSITDFITGTISVDGQYNNNGTWTTVGSSLPSTIYNGHSIFEYLPNITGIKLDESTFTSTIEGITNINLQNITGLTTFSIQNCTNLTEDIDLSAQTNITEVDASGTSVNVLIPQNSKLTKYELGLPTEVSIVNPTVLQPSGVVVDDNTSLTSLELINIPGNKTFTMFGKIMGIS